MKLLPAFLLLLFGILFASESGGQNLHQAGSRSQALAGATVVLSDCWSVYGNQAGLAGLTRSQFGLSLYNRFLVKELSLRAGFFVLPVQSSVLALSLSQFGVNPFRQEKIGFAFARQLSPRLSAGLQFNYYRMFLPEQNRSAGSAGLELGFQYLLNDRLVAGLHVLNPYQTGIKTLTGFFNYPTLLNLGVRIHLTDSFLLISELENELNHQLAVRAGMEYVLLEKLVLRTGISGKPYQLAAGIGFQVKKLTIDLAGSSHQYLGSSPSVSLQYQF